MIYSDDYLEHWGREFLRLDLYRQRGIRFETFVMMPVEILATVAAAPRGAPLLPAQGLAMHRQVEAEALRPCRLPKERRLLSGAAAILRRYSRLKRGVA
jgi:hypothetical protein